MTGTDLEFELKTKRICRFCLSQDDKSLSNLYSRENRLKSSAPLPLQVMACVSIEVFTNDGMPSKICDMCRMLMEHCYRFKQMCKKADTALRQFPLTGKWPSKLDHPKVTKVIEELINTQNPKIINSEAPKLRTSDSTLTTTPEKQKPKNINVSNTPKQKLLNKNPIKILNKEAEIKREPVLKQPVIKHSRDGTIELVTELIDVENYTEIDPVKSAMVIETNVFSCPHCERSFPLRQLLDIHMVNHSRERNFQCEHCDKKFFTKYDLGKHALIHSNEKPYKCIICEKSFTRATLLLRHEKIHTDVPKFLCVHCEKPFISKEVLEKHTERHNKKRPFPCKMCKVSFAFKQGLERHELIHQKEQPFPCQYCNLSFPTPSKLSRHLTAHAGARPYPCKICNKAYLLSHHLSRHLRSHKEGAVNFKCYDCDHTFTSRDSLIYHSAVHATQNLLCPICKEQFEDIDSVTDHIKMHALGEQYACEYCDLIFMTQTKLDDHCVQDHADEIAVYGEPNKANIKQENEFQQEVSESEILQEFIIEEYDNDASNEATTIKQETITENNYLAELISSSANKRKGKKKSENNEFAGENKKTTDPKLDVDMLDDFTEEESALFEELIQEPPTKISKIEEIESQNEEISKDPLKSKLKMKQATLTDVIHNIPKDVTISKKEKRSSARVINERIVCESDNSIKNEKSKYSTTTRRTNRIFNKSNEGNQISEISKTIKVGDKKIQVKQITVTKAQVEMMAEQGRLTFDKDGTMILTQDRKSRKS